MDDWKPIESAPRDGTKILLYGKIWPETVVGYWQDSPFLDTGWAAHPLAEECSVIHNITHWMPLPTPPNRIQEDEG